MYQLEQTERHYFKPVLTAESEVIEWFDYVLVPGNQLKEDDMIWGSLLSNECRNYVVRVVTHYNGRCGITISEFGSMNWYTEFFAADEEFLVSKRWRDAGEECDEF